MASAIPAGMSLDKLPSAPPPPGVIPNFTNPPSLSSTIMAVTATTLTLTISLLVIRLYTTLRITHSASYDDCAIVLAVIFAIPYAALVVDSRKTAVHGWDFPIVGYSSQYFKKLLASVIFTAAGFFFSKLSILLLLFRLFNVTKKFRYFIYAGIVWVSVVALVTIFVSCGLCAPRPGESFSSVTTATRCSHSDVWAVVAGVLYVILDFYVLCLPIPMVWRLQMGPRRKLGVSAIFMTGFIACFASVLSLAYRIILLNNNDLLWNTARVRILSMVELNIAIMVACMPACASFMRHFTKDSTPLSSLRSRLRSHKSRPWSPSSNSTPVASHSLSKREKNLGGKWWRLDTIVFSQRTLSPGMSMDRQGKGDTEWRDSEKAEVAASLPISYTSKGHSYTKIKTALGKGDGEETVAKTQDRI